MINHHYYQNTSSGSTLVTNCEITSTNSVSNSCSTYQGPPVISLGISLIQNYMIKINTHIIENI